MKFFIRTFGCQQNVADSERIASYYLARGFNVAENDREADLVVINSCMVRDKAEERVYGYIRNLQKQHGSDPNFRIVLTGCIVGAAAREPSGKLKKKLEQRIPGVELLPIDEVGFEYAPMREWNKEDNRVKPKTVTRHGLHFAKDTRDRPASANASADKHGWVVISNGCNNFCSFCIVPFSRGREVSRPYEDILNEVRQMVKEGYTSVTLLGQNVNSYGSDIFSQHKDKHSESSTKELSSKVTDYGLRVADYTLPNGKVVEPVMVKHLGRHRIPTLFPYLLEDVAKTPGIEKVTFTSSNPWDFSDELIETIARNKNIDRMLHLPVQSGSNKILKAMNRWYTREEYLDLIGRIKKQIPDARFLTDIIVGFPGETKKDFEDTLDLVRNVGFVRAFVGCYSPRPGTTATKEMRDVIPWEEKKRRFHEVDAATNRAHVGVAESQDWIKTRVNKQE